MIKTNVTKTQKHSLEFIWFLGVFAMGFGTGIYSTILIINWDGMSVILKVILSAISFVSLIVAILSFSKYYQTDSKKDNRPNENLRIRINKNTHNCTDDHKTNSKPFHNISPFVLTNSLLDSFRHLCLRTYYLVTPLFINAQQDMLKANWVQEIKE